MNTGLITLLVFMVLVIAMIIIVRMVLTSSDDTDLTMNLKRGELNIRKRKKKGDK